MNEDDLAYYRARAAAELQHSRAAAHQDLASRYLKLIGDGATSEGDAV